MGKIVNLALVVVVGSWIAERLPADENKETPQSGHILIYKDNYRTLEGDVEYVDGIYRIRRGQGETSIPADEILAMCQSKEDAYQYLRKQANLRDPDERMRLARWCHLRGLKAQALEEAAAAVELRPGNAESQRFLAGLKRSIEAGVKSTQPTGAEPKQAAAASQLAAYELDAKKLATFSTRVQPILMNACAQCHANGKGGSFKLHRVYDSGTMSRRTTQQNLAAVMGQLTRDNPHTSPLLTKAVSIHGDTSASPFTDRKVPAFRSLEEWVYLTVGQPLPQEKPAKPEANPTESEVNVILSKAETSFGVASEAKKPSADGKPAPKAKSPSPADPFDPELFNQQ